MRGHQPLIELRMQRKLPGWVSVNVSGATDWLADNWHEAGFGPQLRIEPSDAIHRLDLRMLVGVPLVDVSGMECDRERVLAVIDACQKAGVRRVIGALHRPKGESIECVEFFDTAGVITWQE